MKYVFVLIAGILSINYWNFNSNKYNRARKIGVDLSTISFPLDPNANLTLSNAFFSNNMYSNIIDVDHDNKYTLNLASAYWFDKTANRVVFEFEKSIIDAETAAFNLKRMVYQSKQLHSDFWNIICSPDSKPENCEKQIYVQGENLVIEYFNTHKSNQIIPTLASVDYKIVPLKAFDSLDYKTAKIDKYNLTSGPYYLEIQKNGDLTKYTLIRNTFAPKNIYKKFEVLNMSAEAIFKDKNLDILNQVDIISTTVSISKVLASKLKENKWNYFSSHNISLYMLVFSKNAIRKTNASNRFSIAKRIFSEIRKKSEMYEKIDTIEFFQNFGQGYLNDIQKNEILNLRENNKEISKVELTLAARTPDKWKDLDELNSDIRVEKLILHPSGQPENLHPDIYSVTNDLSFDLNLSLISYAANVGLLDLTKEQVNEFAEITDENEKIKFINEAHFRTLKNCQIYPMWATPYFTVFKGEFTHELSKFNSRTLLWKIH